MYGARILTFALLSGVATAALGCGADSAEPDVCDTPLVLDTTFSVPKAPGDRNFQAHTTFDGRAIWMTHATAVAADQSLRIRALRIQCDGTISSEEVGVEEQSGLQTEPRIASHGGTIMLAWQRDTQSSGTNLETYYKLFDRDGDPSTAEAVRLETQYGGAPAGNTWMPELDASEAGFVLAGLRGVEGFDSFQAFAQRFDASGSPLGETINGELTDDMAQNMVSASMDDDGALILGWTRESDNEMPHAVHVRVESEEDTPANAPIRVCSEACTMLGLGGTEAHGQYAAVANADGTLSLKDSTLFNVEAPVLQVRSPGPDALYPTIASSEHGAAVAWLEPTMGYSAEIHLQAFRGRGYDLELVGEELTVSTDSPAIGPYRLSLTHIQDAVYMLTWTEGPTDVLSVKWRFLQLGEAIPK